MSKRFVDTARYRQAWRKLDPKLRAAYYWLTENSDAAGFWKIDLDHFRFECGYALDLDRFIKETGSAKMFGDVIQLVDFIEVNYGTLKEGYNPHKPALRALAHHQTSSLNQASTKLEDEEEGEEEDNTQGKKERASEPEIIPVGMSADLWSAFKRWERYRVESRKKLTPSGKEALIKQCMAMGDQRAIAAIDHSIAQGWQGMYEPKQATNGQANQSDEQRRAERRAIIAERYAGQ